MTHEHCMYRLDSPSNMQRRDATSSSSKSSTLAVFSFATSMMIHSLALSTLFTSRTPWAHNIYHNTKPFRIREFHQLIAGTFVVAWSRTEAPYLDSRKQITGRNRMVDRRTSAVQCQYRMDNQLCDRVA